MAKSVSGSASRPSSSAFSTPNVVRPAVPVSFDPHAGLTMRRVWTAVRMFGCYPVAARVGGLAGRRRVEADRDPVVAERRIAAGDARLDASRLVVEAGERQLGPGWRT